MSWNHRYQSQSVHSCGYEDSALVKSGVMPVGVLAFETSFERRAMGFPTSSVVIRDVTCKKRRSISWSSVVLNFKRVLTSSRSAESFPLLGPGISSRHLKKSKRVRLVSKIHVEVNAWPYSSCGAHHRFTHDAST